MACLDALISEYHFPFFLWFYEPLWRRGALKGPDIRALRGRAPPTPTSHPTPTHSLPDHGFIKFWYC